jgi:integrase/recombinase XerC
MRKKIPPYVQRVGKRFRAWAMLGGKRVFGPCRDLPQDAHADALRMRSTRDFPVFGGTFGVRSEEWLDEIASSVAPDTVEFYRSHLRSVQRTIPPTIQLGKVTPPVLRVFIGEAAKRGLGARSIQHAKRVMHNFCNWCMKRGFLLTNPVAAVEWPKVSETQPDVMTSDELTGLLARVQEPWARSLMLFLAYTGLRRAEMARLRVQDVDRAQASIWVQGKARAQAHPIPADALPALDLLLVGAGPEDYVIPGSTERSRRNRIAETFRFWQKKLEEPRLHPHALRHSVATILLRQGVGAATVQRFLRHSSFAMTQRYVHLVESDLRQATAGLSITGIGPSAADTEHARPAAQPAPAAPRSSSPSSTPRGPDDEPDTVHG